MDAVPFSCAWRAARRSRASRPVRLAVDGEDARIVGTKGKVVALDIDESALKRLEKKLKIEGINNTEIVLGPAEKRLPYKEKADIIFLGTVLHDFEDQVKVLKNAKYMLKPSGLIYNFDWRKVHGDIGPPYEIRLNEADVLKIVQEAGLKIMSSAIIDNNFYETRIIK